MCEECRVQRGTNKDKVTLLISVMCVVGAIHIEWKGANFESKPLDQTGKNACKSKTEEPESDLSDGK